MDSDSDDLEPETIGDLFLIHRGPLTAEDIERIKEVMDELITHLFQDEPDQLEVELEADLVDKIDAFIGVVDLVQGNPDYAFFAEKAPILSARLRELYKISSKGPECCMPTGSQ